MSAVRNGATLLVTGVVDRDEHWIPMDRSRELGLRAAIAPVAQDEALRVDGVDLQAGFHGDAFQRIEKEIVDDEEGAGVHAVPLGKGKVIWCPLPLETASESGPVTALYRYALKQAGVRAVFSVDHADPSVLIRPSVFARSVLYTLINESGQHKQINLTHLENQARISVPLPPQRAAHAIVDRSSGQIAAELFPV